MHDFAFTVEHVEVDRGALAPTLVLTLRITSARAEPVHAIALRTTLTIASPRRRYQPGEAARLTELFGRPDQWRHTLRPLRWTEVSTIVPSFEGEARVALRVACTSDMDLAATKYFSAVRDGEIPLELAFAGTAFVDGPAGIAVFPLSRDASASWRMDARVWHRLMEAHFPGHRWIRLRPERFDALARYRATRALPSWDAALDELLAPADELVGRP